MDMLHGVVGGAIYPFIQVTPTPAPTKLVILK